MWLSAAASPPLSPLQDLRALEKEGGLAALDALAAVELQRDASTSAAAASPEVAYIWA